MCLLVTQSCVTLCDPIDCSLPASSVHGILQARKLEWKKKKRKLEWEPFSSLGDVPNPEFEPRSLALKVDSLPSGPTGKS